MVAVADRGVIRVSPRVDQKPAWRFPAPEEFERESAVLALAERHSLPLPGAVVENRKPRKKMKGQAGVRL
jgi:hypothetical protein